LVSSSKASFVVVSSTIGIALPPVWVVVFVAEPGSVGRVSAWLDGESN
jgi:hypothetical protein